MTQSATEYAETEGPNASLEQGQATQMRDLAREAGVFALGGRMGTQSSPGPGATPTPTQAPGPPTQPPPQGVAPSGGQPAGQRQPFALSPPMRPLAPAFEQITMLARHPQAGLYLKALAGLHALHNPIAAGSNGLPPAATAGR